MVRPQIGGWTRRPTDREGSCEFIGKAFAGREKWLVLQLWDCVWDYRREMSWGGAASIHLAQGGDQWKVLVDMVVKLRIPQSCKILE
jgi:hypothetical protein